MEEQTNRKVTRNDTIAKLKKLGVQITHEEAPFGKIKNASMMLEEYRPIYISEKKGVLFKIGKSVKDFVNWRNIK